MFSRFKLIVMFTILDKYGPKKVNIKNWDVSNKRGLSEIFMIG